MPARLRATRPLVHGASGIALVLASSVVHGQAGEGDDLERLRARVETLQEAVRRQGAEIEDLRALALGERGVARRAGTPREEIGRFPDDAVVTGGAFPGSIYLPEWGVSMRVGGFVRADVVHDLDTLGFDEAVSVRTIPLDDSDEDGDSQTRLSVRSSRLNFDVRGDTELGPFRTFIEADFFGDGNELSSNYQLRLRHAIAGLGNFYVGQWWSAFDDTAALPESGDDGGPLGAPVVRQPGLRWAHRSERGWKLGVSVENPAGDLSAPSGAELASESVPDLILYGEATRGWGRVRVAALGRRLESANDRRWVGGVNASGRITVPWLDERDNVSFQLVGGEGITRYLATFAGAGLDGIVDAEGDLEPVGVLAGYVGYQHWWSECWRSTLVLSALSFDLPDGAGADAVESAGYLAGNVFWSPVDRVTVGLDAIYADVDTPGGGTGAGFRLMATARYTF
ncbi:MAG: DcaP family trimeric outer membrane transporter [Planctomycetota bacterium]